jgi:hypothetical protein
MRIGIDTVRPVYSHTHESAHPSYLHAKPVHRGFSHIKLHTPAYCNIARGVGQECRLTGHILLLKALTNTALLQPLLLLPCQCDFDVLDTLQHMQQFRLFGLSELSVVEARLWFSHF